MTPYLCGEHMYAKSLTIKDFKCIERAELRFQFPGRKGKGRSPLGNVNLILGNNGAGKSSVLRAIAISILAQVLPNSGFLPYRYVRRPPGTQALLALEALLGNSELKFTKLKKRHGVYETIELTARMLQTGRGNDRFANRRMPASEVLEVLYDDLSPAFFLVGFGATRHPEAGVFSEGAARKARTLRYQRVASLFEDHLGLRPLQSWLPQLNSKRRNEVVARLNEVLPANIRFTGKVDKDDGQFLFRLDGHEIPFAALSDGYKTFIAWVGDLLGHLCDVSPSSRALNRVDGIVLVDEIDLHLHPSWQRQIVPALAKSFPRIQFVFTTHSPLVASNVHSENIFVAEAGDAGVARILQFDERVYGLDSEQLLLGSYFGLQTTRPPSFQDRAGILFQKAAMGDQRAALEYLDDLSGRLSSPRKPKSKRKNVR